MQFKQNVFYIKEESLLQILAVHGRGPDTKDYEYIVSILAKRLFESKFRQPFTIVFEVNNKHKVMPGNVKLTADEGNEILRTYLEENTPVDFGLAPGTPGKFEGYAYPFQVKRFIGKSIDNMENELVKFINSKIIHYNDPNLSLIIIPELPDISPPNRIDKKVSITDIQKGLTIKKNPLRSIFLLEIYNNKERLIQIWPTYSLVL